MKRSGRGMRIGRVLRREVCGGGAGGEWSDERSGSVFAGYSFNSRESRRVMVRLGACREPAERRTDRR